MTKLLEKAFREAAKLSEKEQDALALAMLTEIASEEQEDYLEIHDLSVQARIEKSNQDIRAGRTRPAAQLLEEARKESRRKTVSHRRASK